MASKKEFEILFAMNARMNGGFSGTFSKAQAEFTRLGKEIQSLHKVQGDIASYQKQQSAIEATRSKLESLQKQHDLLQKEIGETDGSTTALERENAKLEQRIKDTETALERQNQKLQTTGARLEDAKIDTDDLAGESARLSTRLDELRQRQENVADSAQKMGQAHQEAAGDAADFGEQSTQAVNAVQEALAAAGIAVALKEIADAYMECVGVAAEFEEAMSGVQAISGATKEELELLSAKAKEMGASTKFTAKEASDAMGYMAMAGWKANDMLGGLEGIMDLAAASGEDLASTSDIVTDALTAFNLKAADSGRFADILAVAASNANTNVSMMGDTFKYVAPVAGALGYSAEDAAVFIGLMANSGIKASQAGTQLRAILTRLSTDAGASSTKLGALGVLTEELGVAFYHADGSARALNAVIADSRAAWAGLSQEQQVNYAKTIAGQEAVSGWLALMNAADADVRKLTASVDNCSGAAQRMANIKLDNMNGQLTLMRSAWDALKTTMGEQFIPEMRTLYEVGTDVFGGIDRFIQENPGVVKGIAAGAAVIGTVTAGLMAYSAGAKIAATASALLSASIPGVNIILGVTAGVAALAAGVVALSSAADDGVPSVKELTEAARDMKDAMDEAGATFEQTATQTVATAEAAGIYIDRLEKMEAAEGDSARSSQEYQNVLGLLLRTMPELSDCISETTDGYGRSVYALETDTRSLRANTEELKKNAQARTYQEYLNTLYDQYGSVLQEAAENSIKLTQAQTRLDTAEENHAAAVERMNEINEIGIGDNQELLQEYWQLENALTGYNDEILKAQDEIDDLNEAIKADAEAVAAAEAEIKSAEDAVSDLTGALESNGAATSEASEQTEELANQMEALRSAYAQTYQSAYDSISGQFGLFQEAAVEIDTSVNDMIKSLESQSAYMETYAENLQKAAAMGLSDGLIAQLSDGSVESAAYLQEIVTNGQGKIKELNEAFAQVQEGKDDFSNAVAELQLDLDTALDDMVTAAQDAVDAMSLPEEAAQAAKETIRAYISGVDDMRPQIASVFADAATLARYAMRGADAPKTRAYASGTDNAERGFALVGEDGPEVVWFNGGEKVLNAAQTAALQTNAMPAVSAMLTPQAGRSSPPVSVTFQIQGNATQETVQSLREFADEIVGRVMDTLEDANEDTRRRAY